MKNKMRFFEEPDDNKGGEVFDKPAEETPPTEKPTETTLTGSPAAPTQVDAKALAKEFGGVIAEAMGKGKQEEAPKLTPEEAKRLLNVWDPSAEWVKKFDNLETRNEALAEMRDGLIKHADTITQHRLHELSETLTKKFSPALEALQEMQNQQRDARFDKTYPQLAKPTLKPLIEAVADNLVEQEKTFDSETEMFDAIASGVEVIIKETNPDFKLEKTSGSNPAEIKKTNSSIPVTTPGAGGGTGKKGGSNESPKKRGLAVFDK